MDQVAEFGSQGRYIENDSFSFFVAFLSLDVPLGDMWPPGISGVMENVIVTTDANSSP